MWWIQKNRIVYCQMQVLVYFSGFVNIPCVYSSIHNVLPHSCVFFLFFFSNSVIISRIPLSDEIIFLIQWQFSSNLMISFTCYCVFDGINFLNSIFAVTRISLIFWAFVIVINVCILLNLGYITTALIIPIAFNGSIAVF